MLAHTHAQPYSHTHTQLYALQLFVECIGDVAENYREGGQARGAQAGGKRQANTFAGDLKFCHDYSEHVPWLHVPRPQCTVQRVASASASAFPPPPTALLPASLLLVHLRQTKPQICTNDVVAAPSPPAAAAVAAATTITTHSHTLAHTHAQGTPHHIWLALWNF